MTLDAGDQTPSFVQWLMADVISVMLDAVLALSVGGLVWILVGATRSLL
jgi:hypothetical protein